MRSVGRSAGVFLVSLLLFATLPATLAFAHKLKAFAFAEGVTIRGSVYFSGNLAARNARIQVFDPSGGLLAETTSDSEGRFIITARRHTDHRIVANTGDGHEAEYVVHAAELPPTLVSQPPTSGAPASAKTAETADQPVPAIPIGPSVAELEKLIERTVARQVGPLREQLAAFEERIRWHDVLGGLGYILGVTGVAYYLIARRDRRS